MKTLAVQRKSVARTTWVRLICVLLLWTSLPAQAGFSIAKGGQAKCVIVRQPQATLAESNAVREFDSAAALSASKHVRFGEIRECRV